MHKYPRRIHIRESLPTGPSGKVLKRVIVEELG
jgi:acyl-CoA synthetase (AMP-forming)/AMP-acid ligase II